MGPKSVVLSPPSFDEHLGLSKSIENLPVEHLISEFSIKRFVVPILPGAAWFDEQGLDSDPPKSTPDRFSSKFGPIV